MKILQKYVNYGKIIYDNGDEYNMAKTVVVTAEKIQKREKFKKVTKIVSLILIILLFIIFLVLRFLYNSNRFTVSIDRDIEHEGLAIYDNIRANRVAQRKLFAKTVDNMDNITLDWLPKDIHTSSEGGSHNGDNYVAYTFYIENEGDRNINYWYSIIVDDVIKRVDEAIRVVIYLNDGERKVYAKVNSETKKAEPDTTAFYSRSKKYAILESRNDFKPGDIDKMTVVIFIEGEDPECLNDLIGGEIKMHMEITEETIADVD